MKRRKTVIAVFIMLTILLVGCGKGEDLTGKWKFSDDITSETIELFSDGTGIMEGTNTEGEDYKYDCTWVAENGRIKFTLDLGVFGDSSITYDYKYSKSELTFISEDGDEGIYYKQ